MYEYRQVIYRMRLGESDRSIAKAGLMGRSKAAGLRQLAKQLGWLDKPVAFQYFVIPILFICRLKVLLILTDSIITVNSTCEP